jgi:hypothetical protein
LCKTAFLSIIHGLGELSGEWKSPAFRAITMPMEEREKSLIETYRSDVELKQAERDILQARLNAAKTPAPS